MSHKFDYLVSIWNQIFEFMKLRCKAGSLLFGILLMFVEACFEDSINRYIIYDFITKILLLEDGLYDVGFILFFLIIAILLGRCCRHVYHLSFFLLVICI